MLKPLNGQVVLRRFEAASISPGGVSLINPKQEPHGTVVAVSPGNRDLRPGDVVVFDRYGGTEIEHAGEELLSVHEDRILGVFE